MASLPSKGCGEGFEWGGGAGDGSVRVSAGGGGRFEEG